MALFCKAVLKRWVDRASPLMRLTSAVSLSISSNWSSTCNLCHTKSSLRWSSQYLHLSQWFSRSPQNGGMMADARAVVSAGSSPTAKLFASEVLGPSVPDVLCLRDCRVQTPACAWRWYHKSKNPFRQSSENALKSMIYGQERNFEHLTQLSHHQTASRIITTEVFVLESSKLQTHRKRRKKGHGRKR